MSTLNKTEVMILGTIHGFHKDNELYSYDDVFSTIDKYKPDVIGVEIRDEDISQPREYLKKYYPYEMIETKFRYENQCSIYGFDWVGESIEGKLIPEGYYETFEVKVLEKEFDSTNEYEKEKEMIRIIDEIRISLIIKGTCEECNNGKYDIASQIFYSQLEIMFKDTPYEVISKFYRDRDTHIDNNIIKIIEENKGKRIIFLTGIDHRGFAVKALKNHFGDEIVIKEVVDN